MPANVDDGSLRGRRSTEQRHGHAKGGNATWRTYAVTKAKKAVPEPPAESWWLGLSREQFAAQVLQRRLSYSPVAHWHENAPRSGWK